MAGNAFRFVRSAGAVGGRPALNVFVAVTRAHVGQDTTYRLVHGRSGPTLFPNSKSTHSAAATKMRQTKKQ